jgi:hypothetical protein
MAISKIGGSNSSIVAPTGLGTVVAGLSSTGTYTFTPKVGARYQVQGWLAPGTNYPAITFTDGTTSTTQQGVALGTAATTNAILAPASATSATINTPWTATNILGLGVNTITVVRYLGGQYIAGSSVGSIYTSPDGISWTFRATPWAVAVADIAYNGSNLYMALNTSGGTASSPTGVTWTVKTATSDTAGNAIAYGGSSSLFVAAGTTFYTSTNGTAWTARTSAISAGAGRSLGGVIWNGTVFTSAVTGSSSNTTTSIQTSSDGITWAAQTLPSSPGSGNRTLSWLNNRWFLTGTSTMYTSPNANGTSWISTTYTYPTIVGSTDLYGMAYGNSTYVAIGSNLNVATSSDAITWTLRTSANGNNSAGNNTFSNCVTYGSSNFVTNGSSSYGNPFYSTTGLNGPNQAFALFSDAATTIN